MITDSLTELVLLAQDNPAPAAPGGIGQILFHMILIMVIFYFILIRPQKKQQQKLEAMRSQIQLGDDVITAGGIHGRVTGKTDRTVTLRVGDGAKIKFEKASISQIFPKDQGGADTPAIDETEGGEEAGDGDSKA